MVEAADARHLPDVPDARARRRERVRDDLVAAAWQLAERDGITGLSLRDLAAELGMRAPSLYTYVGSKADIYDLMFADGYRQLDAVVLDAADVPSSGTDVQTLAQHIAAFVTFCRASVPRYQLLFTRVVGDWEPSPASYAVSEASYRRMEQRLARFGIVGAHVELLTALTAGLAAQQLANDPDGDRYERLSHEAAAMVLAHARRT